MAGILDGVTTGYKVEAAVVAVDVLSGGRRRQEENRLSVEFVLYVLIIAASAVACGFAIRTARPLPGGRRSKAKPVHPESQRSEAASRPGDRGATAARPLVTPAPWGWPSSAGNPRSSAARRVHARGASSTLQRWADQLVAEKKTLEDQGYKAHREECIRALLEDRFCSQKRASAAELPRHVNGHAAAEHMTSTVDRQQQEKTAEGRISPVPLGDVRKPWGW